MRKLSGINVNYIYKILLFRVTRIYLKKKKDLPISISSKNPGQIKTILTSSQCTVYVQSQVLHQLPHPLYNFFFSSSFYII